ncbi:MAG TPA: hypothetical protein VGM91_19310 [Conexibacter sp.]
MQWIECADPWVVEASVVRAMQPPLNREHNTDHPFYVAVGEARDALRAAARRNPAESQLEHLDASGAHRCEAAVPGDQRAQQLQVDQVAEPLVVAAAGVGLGAGVDLPRDLVAN